MNALFTALLFGGVVFWDYVPIIKKGRKKETWVYAAFLAVSLAVLLLYSFDVPLPSFDRTLGDALHALIP